MKVAILAGGLGTRLAEETEIRPKPMVEIGGHPILWHIMKHYSHFGHREFVVALGYKGEYIKRFFSEYRHQSSDLTIDLGAGTLQSTRNGNHTEDWIIELIETGRETATGGRIKRLAPVLGDGTFMLTWGDGVSNIDLDELLEFHRSHGKLATVTAVRPPARFGKVELDNDRVVEFSEKPQLAEGWINGAFFVLEPGVFEYVEGDDTQWELEPLEGLARDGELMAYRHDGFWQCMDTVRDKKLLQSLWESDNPPWRIWE
jgi:glucose-1-phosphate cytidylyltransferase